ncbi:MAG: hypothetical protein AAFQ36_12080 [Pseudomonadota bacterium]
MFFTTIAAVSASAQTLPDVGTFIGIDGANGMILRVARDGSIINGTFSQPNMTRSTFQLRVEEENLAVGVLLLNDVPVVMTLESIDRNQIVLGTVPLDDNSQPIEDAARGFEFVRQ